MFIYTVWYEDPDVTMTWDIYENRQEALEESRKHNRNNAAKWIQINTRTCAEWRHGNARWGRDLVDNETKQTMIDIYRRG